MNSYSIESIIKAGHSWITPIEVQKTMKQNKIMHGLDMKPFHSFTDHLTKKNHKDIPEVGRKLDTHYVKCI